MTPNKRDLKAYSRFDGTGRIVPGSTVLRRQKPKVGKWKEVQAYECCNVDQVPVLVNTEGITFPANFISIEVGPNNGNWFQPLTSYTEGSAANMVALAAAYNNLLPNLGHFRELNGDLFWTPSIQIAEFYAGNNATSLYANAFED